MKETTVADKTNTKNSRRCWGQKGNRRKATRDSSKRRREKHEQSIHSSFGEVWGQFPSFSNKMFVKFPSLFCCLTSFFQHVPTNSLPWQFFFSAKKVLLVLVALCCCYPEGGVRRNCRSPQLRRSTVIGQFRRRGGPFGVQMLRREHDLACSVLLKVVMTASGGRP